ncbi:MAG: glycosyltransferase [Acidobacteria bacterium]|nr:MAG: glycosyltransferase [Acidobacteriota bacterium]
MPRPVDATPGPRGVNLSKRPAGGRSVVVVHYRTAALAALAVAAVERTWVATRRPGDRLLLIDNGSTAAEREALSRLPCELHSGHGNIGYAGAINRAARACDDHDLVVLNADLEALPECIDQMFSALAAGISVCGPALFWDRELTIHMPPAQAPHPLAALGEALEGRSRLLDRHLRQAFRRAAHRHWNARAPIASWRLSGAALGLRHDALARVGPFDEGFRLYFEETDWLRRARRQGGTARYLPGARAAHLYDRSPDPPGGGKAAWFEASATRFRRRHQPHLGSLLERLAGSRGGRRGVTPPASVTGCPEASRWVEWSPRASGFPMAARRGADCSLPADLAPRAGGLWVRCVDARGRESEAR